MLPTDLAAGGPRLLLHGGNPLLGGPSKASGLPQPAAGQAVVSIALALRCAACISARAQAARLTGPAPTSASQSLAVTGIYRSEKKRRKLARLGIGESGMGAREAAVG